MSNNFSAVGHLGADVEVRSANSGTTVANFNVAVKTGFGERERTMWIRCALFGKRAESGLIQYLTKGQEVFITGELSENEYQGNDGAMRKSLELNLNDVKLVGGSKQQQGQGGYGQSQQHQGGYNQNQNQGQNQGGYNQQQRPQQPTQQQPRQGGYNQQPQQRQPVGGMNAQQPQGYQNQYQNQAPQQQGANQWQQQPQQQAHDDDIPF